MDHEIKPNSIIRWRRAQISNTRLMGVVGMYVHWEVTDPNGETCDLHYFLRYEAEMKALTLIAVGEGDSEAAYQMAVFEYFGPLGGEMVDITEKECYWLGNFFADNSLKGGRPVSKDAVILNFFDARRVELPEDELKTLFAKMCVPVKTGYGIVNYYIMRCMGHDLPGMAYFTAEGCEGYVERIDLDRPADMLRNSSTEFPGENGETVYMCETLAAVDIDSYIVLSEIHIKEGKVVYAKKKRTLPVSPLEAAFMLGQPEFIRTYEISGAEKALTEHLMEMVSTSMVFKHDAGTVYMQIKPDNDHVENRVFLLSADVEANFFINLNRDQLLIVTYSEEALAIAHKKFSAFFKGGFLTQTNEYLLHEPCFLDFIQTDFEYFEEYMEEFDDPEE